MNQSTTYTIVRPQVGHRYEKVMPYSEVCLHMRIAGQRMAFEIVPSSAWGHSVQLYDLRDGRPFSSPILTGEAGLFEDSEGYYFYKDGVA